jgi:hypothetical protein
MYCNVCGNVLAADQAVCGKCGGAVAGRHFLSRVEEHLRMMGILWIAYALFHVVGGCVLLIVANTIFGRWSNGEHPAFLHPLLTGIAVLMLVKSSVNLIAGFALLERQSWGRSLALVMAFISLLDIPFGTALGVYTMWVLMSPRGDAEYDRLAASR